jgi:curli biogenesis system outer membrane secretion channel CsgG
MTSIFSRGFVIALASAATAFGNGALAQGSLSRDSTIQSSTVVADKPTLMVMGFEAGTVSAQARDRRGFMHGDRNNENYEPSQLGIGIADMLIEKLLATGQFRLVERKPIESGSGAQFIVTGSVTRFGFEERNVGGIFASVATMGLLTYKQHKTEVALTARIINARTGEIVASMQSDGGSGKGGGLRVFGMGSNGLGGADVSSSNFRSTAIGQATERAVNELAAKILEKKASF